MFLTMEPPLQPPNLEAIAALSLDLCLPVKSDGTMEHIIVQDCAQFSVQEWHTELQT